MINIELSISRCKQCNTVLDPTFDSRKQFCNSSCAATYNNKQRAGRKKEYFCRFCQKSLLATTNRDFCSNQCQGDWRWNQTKAEILRTGKYPDRDYNSIRLLARKFIREEIGWRCAVCNLTEWCGQEAPMVVDHIDGNAENNQINNVRLVCGNCNMFLPTFSGRNRGNGRVWRKERRDADKNNE